MISIIVPVYNAEKFLSACLDSVLSQTYSDWELMAVVDGSTDNSTAILDKYHRQDSRIKYHVTPNQGVSMARNLGIAETSGQYLYFLDADDVLVPDALQSLILGMNHEGVTLVKADFSTIDENNHIAYINKKFFIRHKYDGKVFDADTFYDKVLREQFYIWTCLFRRDIIEKYHLQFIVGCRMMEDAVFLTDYLSHSTCNKYVWKQIYGYRRYANTASDVNRDHTADYQKILAYTQHDKLRKYVISQAKGINKVLLNLRRIKVDIEYRIARIFC